MAVGNRFEGGGFENYDHNLFDFDRDPKDEKSAEAKKEENPDLSILSSDTAVESKKFQGQEKSEKEAKKAVDTEFHSKLVAGLGDQYNPDVLKKAAAKYFDSAAQENPADIKDPGKRKIAEEQSKQIEKICKILSELDGGSKNDVLKNVFFEYVKDVELSRGIADMENKLSPDNSASTASANADKNKTKGSVDFKLLRDQAMRDNPAREGNKMYKIPAVGDAESVEMTREGMTKYSGMLRAKVDEMNQANKDALAAATLVGEKVGKGVEA